MNVIAKWFWFYGNSAYRNHYMNILKKQRVLRNYAVATNRLKMLSLSLNILFQFQNFMTKQLFLKFPISKPISIHLFDVISKILC